MNYHDPHGELHREVHGHHDLLEVREEHTIICLDHIITGQVCGQLMMVDVVNAGGHVVDIEHKFSHH